MHLWFETLLPYPAIFAVALVCVYLLTPAVTRLAVRWGLVDQPGFRRIHARPTPRGGGVAVFAGFHAACAALYLLPWPFVSGCLDVSWWRTILAATGVLLAVGLADDAWNLPPPVKLAGQLAAAWIVWGGGWSFQLLLGHALPRWLDLFLTFGWILLFVNAFNLIDGIDGLATGLGIIAAAGMAGALLLRGLPRDAMALLALMGACTAFLRFNFHPATIFLGDSGSMFIGLILAAVALGTGSKGTALASVGGPLLAAGVPLFDVMLAVWRRSRFMRTGGPSGRVWHADQEHVHHRLLIGGMGHRNAAMLLYAVNALLVALGLLSLFQAALAVILFLACVVVAGFFCLRRRLRRVVTP